MTKEKNQSTKFSTPKSFLVKILQWFYLLGAVACISIPFWYESFAVLSSLNIPQIFIFGASAALVIYCLLLSVSFFTQNTNLLILALVFIFVTTLGALALLAPAAPNIGDILGGNLPSCASDLVSCNLQDGILVASAMLLAFAVPILVLNFITIVGAVKAIAATD